METASSNVAQPTDFVEPVSQAQEQSQTSSTANMSEQPKQDDKAQIKALLGEARATRDVLVDFRAAVESGSFNGNRMLALAKGLSFVEAILNQNQAHVRNLQERLDA